MQTLESLIQNSQGLPSLPEIYIKVSELLESEKSNSHEIGEIIQTDPSISIKILRMVNSAYYGLPNQVQSIPQAITLLGRKSLKNMLMGSILVDVFSHTDDIQIPMKSFWHHSVKTAIIAQYLATYNETIDDSEALFTAGLLHDIGRLVIAKMMPESIAEIEAEIEIHHADTLSAETNVLGFTHPEVSEAIMQKWELPEIFSQCAKNHHKPNHQGPFAAASRITYLASELSQNVPSLDQDETMDVLGGIAEWDQCNCSIEHICEAWQLAEDQSFEIMDSLGMVNMEIPINQ